MELKACRISCDCQDRNSCVLDNRCKTPQFVLRTDVSIISILEVNITTVLRRNRSKRYGDYKSSFRHERSRNATELSKYVWELQKQGKEPIIVWSTVGKINLKTHSDFCKLYALGDNRLLSKKSEFFNKCRNQNKLLLSDIKDSKDKDLEKKDFYVSVYFMLCCIYFLFVLLGR